MESHPSQHNVVASTAAALHPTHCFPITKQLLSDLSQETRARLPAAMRTRHYNSGPQWLAGFLLVLSIALDQNRVGCDSFSLSPVLARAFATDLVATSWTRRRRHSSLERGGPSMEATRGDETWSKTGQHGSRLGVRRRVRRVLDKARKRTGVTNDSGEEEDQRSPNGSFIAEAASLGLLDEADQVVFGSPDVNGASMTYPRSERMPPIVLDETPTANGEISPTTQVSNGAADAVSKLARLTEEDGARSKDAASSAKPNTNSNDEASTDAMPNGVSSAIEVDPLPFTLPKLSPEQYQLLQNGERVQEQSKMGREGSGFVVMDIPAPAYAIWECLLDFEAYPENIGTVRSMRMFTNTHLKQSYIAEKPMPPGTGMETRHYGMASVSRAAFTLSKFRLKIAAIHRYQPHPDGHYMVFTLDKACTNAVLQDAKGIWYTQENPDGRDGYTRIWLLCELRVSPMLPKFIVDYAARRAMPRATTWLPTTVERFCQKWFGRTEESPKE
jgi:hypothetical protein